jgi:hypothetical protein
MENVEPAGATFPDWKGTAAAEASFIKDSGDLYELAGLDHDRWTILGIDMHAFSHGAPPEWTVHVYAFDRHSAEVTSHETLKELETERGSIPVKDILLHNVSLEDVVRCMKFVQIQLLSRHFTKLDVVERGDHPAQN